MLLNQRDNLFGRHWKRIAALLQSGEQCLHAGPLFFAQNDQLSNHIDQRIFRGHTISGHIVQHLQCLLIESSRATNDYCARRKRLVDIAKRRCQECCG